MITTYIYDSEEDFRNRRGRVSIDMTKEEFDNMLSCIIIGEVATRRLNDTESSGRIAEAGKGLLAKRIRIGDRYIE